MTTTLQAQILVANFIQEGFDVDGKPINEQVSYPVYRFSNGLILVPSNTTNDWFFSSADLIDGCGGDIFQGVIETGDQVFFSIEELSESWNGSVREFGDTSCVALFRQLIA